MLWFRAMRMTVEDREVVQWIRMLFDQHECLSYFSTAIQRLCYKDNLQKEAFVLESSGFRGVESLSIMAWSVTSVRLALEQWQRVTSNPQAEGRKRGRGQGVLNWNVWAFESWKPMFCDTSFPVRPHPLVLHKHFYQLWPRTQMHTWGAFALKSSTTLMVWIQPPDLCKKLLVADSRSYNLTILCDGAQRWGLLRLLGSSITPSSVRDCVSEVYHGSW